MLLPIAMLFLASLGQGVTIPLLPALTQSGAADARILGLVYGANAGARILAQPLGGVWVDRFGGKRVLVVASLLYTVSLAGFLVISGPVQALGLQVTSGVATGFAYPAVFALAMQGVPAERQGRRVATVLGVGTSGNVVGPVLAALFATKNVRLPVVLALVPTGLVALALVVGAMLARRGEARASHGEESRPAPRGLRDEVRAMGRLFLDVALVAAALPIAFNKLTFGAFQALLPIYGGERLGLDTRGVSLLFLATGVSFAVSQPLAGWIVDRFPPRAICLALGPLLLALLASLSFIPGRTYFFVGYIGYVVSASIIFVATLKLLTTRYGTSGRHGGLYGIAATLTDPFTVVGPILFMNVYATAKSYTFVVMAAVGVLSLAGFARYTKRGATAA
jgi:DHA1 family multidrug resistance protein-like MFS transporter